LIQIYFLENNENKLSLGDQDNSLGAPGCCDISGVNISVQQISEYGLDSAEDGET
jgi:hypothetical protein